MTARGVVHEIVGGACRVCGDIAEWLEGNGAIVAYLDDVLVDTDVTPVGEGTFDY